MQIPDGYYLAKAVEAALGSSIFNGKDKVYYIRVRFKIKDFPSYDEPLEWKGSLSLGATKKTASVLIACGARMKDCDPTDLFGIEKNEVEIKIMTIECFESPGTFRTFVEQVRRPVDCGLKT